MKRFAWFLFLPAVCLAWNETGENRAIPVRIVPSGQQSTGTHYCDGLNALPVTVAQGPADSTSIIVPSGTVIGLTGAIPAGSNTIGAVTHAQGPAASASIIVPSGTVIGITGAIPAGSNVMGAVTAGQGPAGSASIIVPSGTVIGITGAIPAGSNAIGGVTAAQGPAGSASIIVPSGTVIGITGAIPAGTNAIGGVTAAQGPAGSASIIVPSGTVIGLTGAIPTGANVIGALSANQSVNTAQVSGVNATPFLDSAVSSITSTPFVTTAAQAAKQVLPATTKWVNISIIGTATDYCQCNVNTENNLASSANAFVMPANPLQFTYLRLRAGGATVMCGAGQGTHGLVSGSVTWGTQP